MPDKRGPLDSLSTLIAAKDASAAENARPGLLPEPMVEKRPDLRVDAVVRRCKVCEWEGESIETADANPDCPWCHGPTERSATLATSTAAIPGEKNPHAAALGRLGGQKGGRARAEALTPAQRRRIASRAARARWDKKKGKDG